MYIICRQSKADIMAFLDDKCVNTDYFSCFIHQRPTTIAWIERCIVGSEPLPQSLKIQLACCLLATGVVLSLEQGLAKVAESW